MHKVHVDLCSYMHPGTSACTGVCVHSGKLSPDYDAGIPFFTGSFFM